MLPEPEAPEVPEGLFEPELKSVLDFDSDFSDFSDFSDRSDFSELPELLLRTEPELELEPPALPVLLLLLFDLWLLLALVFEPELELPRLLLSWAKANG